MTVWPANPAELIRHERQWTGFSQAQVAQVLHIAEEDVAAFETGAQAPTEAQTEQLRKLFGLAPGRLLGEPMTEEPAMAILCGRKDHLTAEDRYQVMRFAEYLRHSERAPTIDRQETRDA